VSWAIIYIPAAILVISLTIAWTRLWKSMRDARFDQRIRVGHRWKTFEEFRKQHEAEK